MYEMDYCVPPKQQTIRYESDHYVLWFSCFADHASQYDLSIVNNRLNVKNLVL